MLLDEYTFTSETLVLEYNKCIIICEDHASQC